MTSSATPHPRPDLEAHEHASRADFTVVAKELSGLLGPRLVAYLAGVTETRAVHQWASGERKLRDPEKERILRLALRIARLISDHDTPRVAQSWFQGLNPQLDDRSPARLLREGDLDEVGPQVLAAARAFTAGG